MKPPTNVMKYFLLTCVLIVSLGSRARAADPSAGYSEDVRFVLEQLRHAKTSDGKPLVEGAPVLNGGGMGIYGALWDYLRVRVTPADLARMVEDPSPVVRVFAVHRLHAGRYPYAFKAEFVAAVLARLKDDRAIVVVMPYDGRGTAKEMTVAEVAKLIVADPEKFLHPDYVD